MWEGVRWPYEHPEELPEQELRKVAGVGGGTGWRSRGCLSVLYRC